MTGLPRFAPKSFTVFALAVALVAPALSVAPVLAQEAAAPAAAATTAPAVSADLQSAVENYWHYGKVARYELAAAEGQKIIGSGATPEAVLVAFEAIAAERQDGLDQWLQRFNGIDQMRDVTGQIVNLVSEGYRARRSSSAFITEQIRRLGTSEERAYSLAITRLRESGELAVPFMLDVLKDPAKKSMQPAIRRALRDMGRMVLNPLVASTEMQDWDTLNVVVAVLGDLGYDSAAPYVARLFELKDAPPGLKAVAAEAMAKLGVVKSGASTASGMFFEQGQKFYDQQSSITADVRYPMANIWYWDAQGLSRKQVPHEIFNDLMAMRASEYTLKLGGAKSDDALSLWLAANYRREADLPEGAKDDTRPENYPSGHYWGVEAGAKYLHAALARAIKGRNAAVAFRATRSLQEIVGQSNLFIDQDQSSRPLINAMQFPDRKVRFEAAFALAAALPQTKFEGQQRVIPLLAEAMAQTGQTSVLVVVPGQDAVNKLVEDLKKEGGYSAVGATSAETAVNVASSLPAVDVILVSEDIGPGHVDELFNLATSNAGLSGAARLVMTKTAASIYEPRKISETLLSTTTATDAAGLKNAIEEARAKAGALPLDAAVATEYATRAGELMLQVGLNRGQVYDLAPAKATLLAALNDSRPEIVKLAGQVLALMNDKDAQGALLTAASEEKTADEVRISLYRSLSESAKSIGNKLDASQLQTLEKTVAEAANLDLRSAAAEARGALNLPADQAKSLIVKQSKT